MPVICRYIMFHIIITVLKVFVIQYVLLCYICCKYKYNERNVIFQGNHLMHYLKQLTEEADVSLIVKTCNVFSVKCDQNRLPWKPVTERLKQSTCTWTIKESIDETLLSTTSICLQ